MIKRAFDIIVSFCGLLVTAPVLAVIAVLIKRNSPGPVFYKGTRAGKNNKIFSMFKFRTMVANADKIGGPSTAGDDPRLTTLGKTLKRYKLDELPQLINVLKGEMSLVGPRPEVPFYIDMMSEEERKTILSVRPGITDWASLWDFREEEILRGSADPEKIYQEKIRPEKIRLQIKYAKEHTFLKDLSIILKTVGQIVK